MTECTQESFDFPACQRRRVEARFEGGEITSDGGVLLLRQADRRLGLSEAMAKVLEDARRRASCRHTLLNLVRQRLYALALGYEDLNDHQQLREDLALQTAVERDTPLAGASTLCRWENQADRLAAWRLHEVLLEQFIASFRRTPKRLILDFDATDDAVHGRQQGRSFHGYYDRYCFLPLYVFCDKQLLVSYLRPSRIDAAKHAWAVLALLVKRLRQNWPKVRIVLRADSGFCRWKMLRWCERHNVDYLVGIARNERLTAQARPFLDAAEQAFQTSGRKQRRFHVMYYAAKSWDRRRRIIVKAEHSAQGSNPRYLVTNLKAKPQYLYDRLYCARGEMENRIKEQQLDLFADRTSCHAWWANQFRLLLSSLAYTLLEAIRRLALKGTQLASAYVGTIRLKLLKIGAVITRNTRRVRFLLSSAYPYQRLFAHVAAKLHPT
ncbi:IS1380 family transposase [Thioalkalivibrio denitrificans]|uniref:IS1380 family transposase n=1 Tax=Thioalkalivibrio denitrificans TaxID=108003 RepID=A0A1V3NGM8_9GAMM|nr:IS1380 family transposase [Thioalkalivibrio denitrificans]OOG23936.1 IS1380 family transposase [Thioalkalivibrio denitrificans]